jgi:hypothetical protein
VMNCFRLGAECVCVPHMHEYARAYLLKIRFIFRKNKIVHINRIPWDVLVDVNIV